MTWPAYRDYVHSRFLTAALLLVGTSPAFAHRLHIDVMPTGDQVRVETYYDDNTPAQEAKITISLGDQTVAEGRTDDKGVWTCAKPAAGTYLVRAESVGHAAKETLVVEPGAQPPAAAPTATDERARRTHTPWGRLAVGLAVIGGLWLAWAISRRAVSKADRT
jgi:hypothetical protein